MSKTQTRVVPAVGGIAQPNALYTGCREWLAQYYDEGKGLWFDIGDVKESKTDAEGNESEFRERSKAVETLMFHIHEADRAGAPDTGNYESEGEHLRAALLQALTRWPEIGYKD